MLHGGVYQLQYQPCHDAAMVHLDAGPSKAREKPPTLWLMQTSGIKWHQYQLVASMATSVNSVSNNWVNPPSQLKTSTIKSKNALEGTTVMYDPLYFDSILKTPVASQSDLSQCEHAAVESECEQSAEPIHSCCYLQICHAWRVCHY